MAEIDTNINVICYNIFHNEIMDRLTVNLGGYCIIFHNYKGG